MPTISIHTIKHLHCFIINEKKSYLNLSFKFCILNENQQSLQLLSHSIKYLLKINFSLNKKKFELPVHVYVFY